MAKIVNCIIRRSENNIKFCCSSMEYQIRRQKDPRPRGTPDVIMYDPMTRDFGICKRKGKTKGNKLLEDSVLVGIRYCPFCGTKLPEPLNDEFYDELAKVRGIYGCADIMYQNPRTGLAQIDRNKLPEEFQTDEWWIKRGL